MRDPNPEPMNTAPDPTVGYARRALAVAATVAVAASGVLLAFQHRIALIVVALLCAMALLLTAYAAFVPLHEYMTDTKEP